MNNKKIYNKNALRHTFPEKHTSYCMQSMINDFRRWIALFVSKSLCLFLLIRVFYLDHSFSYRLLYHSQQNMHSYSQQWHCYISECTHGLMHTHLHLKTQNDKNRSISFILLWANNLSTSIIFKCWRFWLFGMDGMVFSSSFHW